VLADGSYDALVLDIDTDGDGEADVVVLAIAITAGAHKGAVVDVRATGLGPDPLALLAMPCLLVVESGRPKVMFD
jgi:hypothetical protein